MKLIIFMIFISFAHASNDVKYKLNNESQTGSEINQEVDSSIKTQGVIGSTCESSPQVFATVDGKWQKIFCFTVEKTFYPGILSIKAKDFTIKKCQDRNALDPSGNYRDADGSCYARCKIDTYCLHGDNR